MEQHEDLGPHAVIELLKVSLENQIKIAETLDLVDDGFDKFEEESIKHFETFLVFSGRAPS